MTEAEHKNRHTYLNRMLYELVEDWIRATDKSPSNCTVNDLMGWSSKQAEKPDHEA